MDNLQEKEIQAPKPNYALWIGLELGGMVLIIDLVYWLTRNGNKE